MENKILIDWFAYSAQTSSKSEDEYIQKSAENLLYSELYNFMGFDSNSDFQELPGLYFYKKRFAFEGVSFLLDGMRKDMGVCCQMSGKGCRTFETFGNGDYEKLFDRCVKYSGMNVSRIDIAYDDFEGLLDMEKICQHIQTKNYVSPLSWHNTEDGTPGTSSYVGSPTSDIRIRFYDKAKEQKIKEPVHWVRCEIQLRRDLAFSFVRNLVENGTDHIGQLFFGVLNNYLRFIVPGSYTSTITRADTASWWLDFVGDLEKIRLYEKPGVEYTAGVLDNYVIGQAGNSICTYLECFGMDNLMENLVERHTALNANQRHLIMSGKYDKASDDEMAYYLYRYVSCNGFDDFSQEFFDNNIKNNVKIPGRQKK